MNLKRRLEALESKVVTEPIQLNMPDGSTVSLRGNGDDALNLLARVRQEARTPEMELIARSISSTEPGDGHLVDLARAILQDGRSDAGEAPVI